MRFFYSMEVKQGYKQTEIEVIPEDWDVKTLNNLTNFRNGVAHEKIINERGEYIVVNSKFISTGGEVKKFSESILCPIYKNEILMVMSDIPKGKAIAKCFFVDKDKLYSLNQRICALRVYENYDSRFLFYKINRHKYFLSFDDGVKQTNLRKNEILSCTIPIPRSKEEQSAIATALSETDELIQKLDKLISKKKDMKKGAIQELLTKKKRLPGFSGEWEEKEIKEMTFLIPSGIYGLEKQIEETFPFRVATTTHINETDRWNKKEMAIRFFKKSQIESFLPNEGDLIIVKSSGSAESIQSGKVGYVDSSLSKTFLFSNFLMLIRPKKINPLFLYYFLTSHKVKSKLPFICESSTYPNIKLVEYMGMRLFHPKDSKEQQAISSVISDMDSEIGELEQKKYKYQMIKEGMMQQLLTGRIRLKWK
jgi:type I restriction enzyme, S subunit